MQYKSHIKEKLSNGNTVHYKETMDGTFYHEKTPDDLVRTLENCRQLHTRILVEFGNVKTGKSWGETNDMRGYVGRSTGRIKVPLLIHNSRSIGGVHCLMTVSSPYMYQKVNVFFIN